MIAYFTDQPYAEDFDKVIPVLLRNENFSGDMKLAAIDCAVRKALRYARKHPEQSVACHLSLSGKGKSVAPVYYKMTRADVYALDRLIRYGEIIDITADMYGKQQPVSFANENFVRTLEEVKKFAPQSVARFQTASKENDFNGTHGALIEIHLMVLNKVDDFINKFEDAEKPSSVLKKESRPVATKAYNRIYSA